MQQHALQFEFEGITVGFYEAGAGLPLLLLHGSGPGASSRGNWSAVFGPLAERFHVYAMDLVGFGQSGRKPSPPYFDYAMWLRQARAMLARIPGEGPVGVVGHSLSGSLALALAAHEPRVAGVLTTGTMGAPFTPNEATHRTWRCPTNRDELVTALRGLIHDASRIDEAYVQGREAVLFAPGYADYFDTMFEGDQQRYVDAAVLDAATLAGVRCPVLMLHGRRDAAFPAQCTLEIAQNLPQADVMLLAECSHSVAFERTDTFLAEAGRFFHPLSRRHSS